jgi:antitoxin (DNA-binding transcriptional repressor) of toxin-antitoxin stability system
MYHMKPGSKTVSVRDLRYDFKKVERLLAQGNELQITKRRKVIARLTPEPVERPPLPDFLARMQANFGEKVLEVTGADLISADREDRF